MMFSFQCSEVNQIKMSWFYVNSLNSHGQTVLEMIVDRPRTENSSTEKPMIKALLTAGADPLKKDEYESTIAAKVIRKYRDSDLTIKCLENIRDIDALLSSRPGHTALFEAIYLGDLKILNYVLGRKPNLNIVSSGAATPLHWAARYQRTNILRILLQKGLDVNAKDVDGETPLFQALKNEAPAIEIVKLFLEYRADLTAVTNTGETMLHALCYHHKGADLGNLGICKLLLESGCNPNSLDDEHYTPLHYAMERLKNGKAAIELIKIFLNYGANLNVQNWHGDSMLHTISKFKSSDCDLVLVFLLVYTGIETNIVNNANKTFWNVLKDNTGNSRVLIILAILVYLESRNENVFKGNLLQSIRADETLSRIVLTFRKEMTYLFKNTISPDLSITWYSMLHSSEKKVAKFCRNEKVRLLMTEFKRERFPAFGSWVRDRYDMGFRRFKAATAASEVLRKKYNGNLQDLSIRRVMGYLSTAVLEKMSTPPENCGNNN